MRVSSVKLSLILILAIASTGVTMAQQTMLDKHVSLKAVNIPIEEALKQITHDYQVNFYYADLPGLTRRVTLTANNESLAQVLKKLLQDTDITFRIIGEKVVLSLKKARKHTVHGYLKDAESGEALIGATVHDGISMSGAEANVYGFYSITLPEDTIALQFSFVGYTPQTVRFFLDRDTVIQARLTGTQLLDEIVVRASGVVPVHEDVNMSTVTIPISQIKALPALLGENDVLKVLQLTPGVQSGNEGSSGLYVRGGGPDQNLILLDGVPVYNASHLFGFFSIFNADAINRVELIKGGFPARYGGRLSSVIEVNTKNGNMEKWQGEASAGILSSKISIEGPIQKDRTSVTLSARRTYLDLLYKPFEKDNNQLNYNFHDINLKVNHIVNARNHVYLSVYQGGDHFTSSQYDGNGYNGYRDGFGLKWRNDIASLRWNRILTPKLFGNLTATYTGYHFEAGSTRQERFMSGWQDRAGNRATSAIQDLSIRADFDFSAAPAHQVRFGAGITNHHFTPGRYAFYNKNGVPEDQRDLVMRQVAAWELDAYASDEVKISDALAANAGVHFSGFDVENQFYTSLQPRLSLRYLVTPDLSIKASYATMAQFMHLLTSSGGGLPNDLWVPSTARVKPQQSEQVALGMATTLRSRYEFTAEAYYKRMRNLVEYKDGASFTTISIDRDIVLDPDKDWENKVYSDGRGDCYGAEFFFQKKTGKLTGWIGYTLSWNYRQFDELNKGKRFPYKYDRRHDISTALIYAWSDRVSLSAAWTFGTGNAITMPVATYRDAYTPMNINKYYSGRNAYRMASYHRLDISATFKKNKKWGQRLWTVGMYNVYNRMNPFYIDMSGQNYTGYQFTQHSLFPAIPFISYGVKF
jgi:outer membrane receptor for ferrienterochelin and colicin